MKNLTRLLLISLCSSLLSSAVSAAEHHEAARVNFTTATTTVLTARVATAIKTVSSVNLSKRVVLTPSLTKGGANVRVNLKF
jgi:hypothetical protein